MYHLRSSSTATATEDDIRPREGAATSRHQVDEEVSLSAVMDTVRSDDSVSQAGQSVSAINTRIKLAAEAARLKAEFAMLQKKTVT